MKDEKFCILGVHGKFGVLGGGGGGSWKKTIYKGIDKKEGGGVFEGSWYPQCTLWHLGNRDKDFFMKG